MPEKCRATSDRPFPRQRGAKKFAKQMASLVEIVPTHLSVIFCLAIDHFSDGAPRPKAEQVGERSFSLKIPHGSERNRKYERKGCVISLKPGTVGHGQGSAESSQSLPPLGDDE